MESDGNAGPPVDAPGAGAPVGLNPEKGELAGAAAPNNEGAAPDVFAVLEPKRLGVAEVAGAEPNNGAVVVGWLDEPLEAGLEPKGLPPPDD